MNIFLCLKTFFNLKRNCNVCIHNFYAQYQGQCLRNRFIFQNLTFVNVLLQQLHTYLVMYLIIETTLVLITYFPEDETTLQRCPIPISGIACKNKNLTLKLHFWNWSSFQKPVKEVQPEGSFGTDKGEGESPGPGVGGNLS